MADRVAVYIDFDNVVISRYDHVHGKGAWVQDGARDHGMVGPANDPVAAKLAEAKVDLGAIIDYATSFGVVAMTRAYADWSVRANAAYRKDLVNQTVDLVQLFPVSGTKNGADIRLAVDAVDDLSRHPDISHVVLVAGDSDYVPLAQRCKRLGRSVVGIGVVGSTSPVLVRACDEFARYEELPGVAPDEVSETHPAPVEAVTPTVPSSAPPSELGKAASTSRTSGHAKASALLVRTMKVAKKTDDGWVYAAALKSQMKRIDPAFDEKTLGFSSFKVFAESCSAVVTTKIRDTHQLVRLR
ncbi:NYN domain-containing protein [Nocardioides sp. T5]|uniref:NYN domain-containing protein n=1 Tax=Nocardioides sp. T5 TaxID=3400182 RepID=UPI003A853964